MTAVELADLICEAIKNNSTIECDAEDEPMFGNVTNITLHDGWLEATVEGKKFSILVEEVK